MGAACDWKKEILPEILESFSEDDIFNADETALYYRGFPDKGHCEKGFNLAGGKKAMDHITALLCTNMSGTEKRPLLVFGKSKRPRSFPKNLHNLPVEYDSSKKAWMTRDRFTRWLLQWDKALHAKKRRICLLIDNCSAHPTDAELSNIVLKFLPPNTTSLIQPLDSGVIKNWKGHYRSRLNSRIISALDANSECRALEVAKTVSVLDALYLAKESWDAVSQETIANCFRKAGFSEPGVEVCEEDNALADVPTPPNMTAEEFCRLCHHGQ